MDLIEVNEIRNLTEISFEPKEDRIPVEGEGRNLLGLFPVFLLVLIIVLRMSWTLYRSFGQKTRNPQQRRLYAGSRARPSLTPQEPSIYVSPSNLPPPPKYECMAPPSYEEVVGVHYPNYQIQPISQPISAALAQAHGSSHAATENVTSSVVTVDETAPAPPAPPAPLAPPVTATTEPRRTSVTVARP